jgi:hypothetical protein
MKRLVFALLLVASSVVGAGALTVASGAIPAHAVPNPVNVYVGYADNLRASAANFPTPWQGDAGVTFDGCTINNTDCTAYDAGAVRVVNTTGSDETIDYVKVHIDTCTFDVWTHSRLLHAGGQLIVTQHVLSTFPGCPVGTEDSFDTSDIGAAGGGPPADCTNDNIKPTVDVSVNGTNTTYTDSAQVLNTGGVDAAICIGNESLQWQLIGGSACAGSSTLTLAPDTQTRVLGTNASVTATFANDCNPPQGLQGTTVNFKVISGPNSGTIASGTTDANGHVTFTYSSSVLGTDTVEASVTNVAGTIYSNDVTVIWLHGAHFTFHGPSSGHFNDATVVSATLTDEKGNPIVGALVSFSLQGTPGTCLTKTDINGLATCMVVPSTPAGYYILTVSYAGDVTHVPTSVNVHYFHVTLEDTALHTAGTIQVSSAGKSIQLFAVLTDPTLPGETPPPVPISGKLVTITLGTGPSCSATTDASGHAYCTVMSTSANVGTQTVSARFLGDAFYQAAST